MKSVDGRSDLQFCDAAVWGKTPTRKDKLTARNQADLRCAPRLYVRRLRVRGRIVGRSDARSGHSATLPFQEDCIMLEKASCDAASDAATRTARIISSICCYPAPGGIQKALYVWKIDVDVHVIAHVREQRVWHWHEEIVIPWEIKYLWEI